MILSKMPLLHDDVFDPASADRHGLKHAWLIGCFTDVLLHPLFGITEQPKFFLVS